MHPLRNKPLPNPRLKAPSDATITCTQNNPALSRKPHSPMRIRHHWMSRMGALPPQRLIQKRLARPLLGQPTKNTSHHKKLRTSNPHTRRSISTNKGHHRMTTMSQASESYMQTQANPHSAQLKQAFEAGWKAHKASQTEKTTLIISRKKFKQINENDGINKCCDRYPVCCIPNWAEQRISFLRGWVDHTNYINRKLHIK